MTPEVQSLIDQLRDQMAGMKTEARVDLLKSLLDGYFHVDGRQSRFTNAGCGITITVCTLISSHD